MSQLFKLTTKGFHPQILKNGGNQFVRCLRHVTIQSSEYIPPKEESHDERNLRLKRPQSPHLTIYRPQLTSMLSITHRATGMALATYTIAFGLAAVSLECPIEHYIEQLHCAKIGAGSIFTLKFLLAFPITYHFWNGIRHLLWDTGKFLSIKEVYATGYAMLAIATASAIVLSAC